MPHLLWSASLVTRAAMFEQALSLSPWHGCGKIAGNRFAFTTRVNIREQLFQLCPRPFPGASTMRVRTKFGRLFTHPSPPPDSAKCPSPQPDLFQSFVWPSEDQSGSDSPPIRARQRADTTTTCGSLGSCPPSVSPTLFSHILSSSSPTSVLCPIEASGTFQVVEQDASYIYRYLVSLGVQPSPQCSRPAEVHCTM